MLEFRKKVYITQFNTPSSRNLMPLAAGLIYSYAIAIPKIRDAFEFEIEIMRDSPSVIVQNYKNPAVLAYSTYFWNLHQSTLVAKEAKMKFPTTLIVFGGPSAPSRKDDTIAFFKEHPYVDIVVSGEGEVIFADILTALAEERELNSINGISYQKSDGTIVHQEKRSYIKDVSDIPSPFLNGTFDLLLSKYKEHMTGVVLETNRGCPFSCTFCYWGTSDPRISQFSLDRIYSELDWISKNKIDYIFTADANFGILKRDVDIARYMARLNRETGHPKVFAVNWTKNTTDRVFDIVDVLKESGLKFMVTTSVQSHNPDTLKAVKRQNIRLESFNKILEEASKRNFSTYSELILGLPLETYASFLDGLRKVLSPNIHYHFNIYQCILIPGTEMAELDYVRKYDIQTRRCVMNLGRAVHEHGSADEYENLVVGTSTLPPSDWKRAHSFAYIVKSLYGFRLAFFLLNYLKKQYQMDMVDAFEFMIKQANQDKLTFGQLSSILELLDNFQESMLENLGNETIKIPGVDASLHPETAVLVTALLDKEGFYAELNQWVKRDLHLSGVNLEGEAAYMEVMAYQYAMVPVWNRKNQHLLKFTYNVHDYFFKNVDLREQPNVLSIGDGVTYANIDEFLQKQIYSGMVFSLLKVSPFEGNSQSVMLAQDLYEQIMKRENTVRGLSTDCCPNVMATSLYESFGVT